jgi:hypothetical protein
VFYNSFLIGLSEYRERIGNVNNLNSSRAQINHSIRDDLIQSHRIRTQKYQNNAKSSLSATGNSEYRTRFNKNITPDQYKRKAITRKDFCNNSYLESLPNFVEKSEYATSFTFSKPIAYTKTAEFTINPTQDVQSAGRGRPLARKIEYDPKLVTSQTHTDHQWPGLENREIFEWIHNSIK